MDAWLSELEMAWNEEPILNHHQNEEIDTLGEELALVLGEDFSFLGEENAKSSLLNYCTLQNPTNLLHQSISNEDEQLPSFFDNFPSHKHNNNDNSPNSIEPIIIQQLQNDHHQNDNIGTKDLNNDQQSTKGGKRKRRDPEQVHGHIMAERKRREVLTQRFIALSALVPGLKKVDKTSILEEAIKHLKQLQEKVKLLEEDVSKQPVRQVMVVKKAQLVVDNDNESDSSIDNTNICASDDSDDSDRQSGTLPEIEVKVSHKTLLLRICCVRRKGILGRIYKEVEDCHLSILNCNVLAFESSALDITIVAQMEAAQGYDKHVKNLVKNLNTTLRIL